MSLEFAQETELDRKAAELDQAAGMPPEGAEMVGEIPAGQLAEAPPPDYYREAAGAVEMVAAMIVGYCPEASPLWDADTKGRVSAALAPVMEKYGVSFGALPPEFTLLLVAGPPLYQSSKLIGDAIQKKRREAEKKAAEEVDRKEKAGISEGPQQEVHPQVALYR